MPKTAWIGGALAVGKDFGPEKCFPSKDIPFHAIFFALAIIPFRLIAQGAL